MPNDANHLDLSALSPTSRRELLDFYQFLLERRMRNKKNSRRNFGFSDLCGKLSWKGDAVAAQREIRDEW